MARPEADEAAEDAPTTGHEWDGIQEFDNPLPRWWLWVFYACIAVAIAYWVMMPAWPGIGGYTKGLAGQSDRANVEQALAGLKAQRGAAAAKLATAGLAEIERDPQLQTLALSVGQSVFGDNCATCHGAGGAGAKGYANLRDDVWLWGGKLDDIHKTITVGVRSGAQGARTSQMPAFGRDQMLTEAQIGDLTELVVALSGRPADAAAISRARPIYGEQCVACHGPAGKGDPAQGAPNLTDADWLYGSDRATIRDQIVNGRGGVMPAWGHRFDEATLKALAVYVHANTGGQ